MRNTRELVLNKKIPIIPTFFSDFDFLDLLSIGEKEFVGRVMSEFRKIGLQWRRAR